VVVAEAHEENALRILRGTLACTSCSKRYPIEQGVPRLVKAADDIAEVGRRFSYQWLSRWKGKFEGERCYGFEDDVYVGWLKGQLECRSVPAPGEWLLDAGCGSGEKTRVLARECPGQNVVGLDLGVEALEKAAAKFGAMPNLDYVQGNLMEPPFKDRQFASGLSIGVLHHTNSTRQALAKFRRMLKEETTCVIWIYPTYREGREWWMAYVARDFVTFGQGHRLPTGLLRFLAYAMVIAFYPLAQLLFWNIYRRIGKVLPFVRIGRLTWKERYNAQVFYCFDSLLPRYQWRHKTKEVESWLVEEGLDPVLHAYSFYTASNVPVRAPVDKAAEKLAVEPGH
jgi:SAM-dependent methyltransferase